MEEARHCGLAYSFGIPVMSVTARPDGSGSALIELLTRGDLLRLASVDESLVLDIVTTYAAVAMVGDTADRSPQDEALSAHATYLYSSIVGRSAESFMLLAESRATHFCLAQRYGITRFAQVLAANGHLSGEGLRMVLARCFERCRALAPTAATLEAFLATRQAEQEVERKAEARAARLRQIAKFEKEHPKIHWR
jgi:hypothetical protein